ncbi:MAG: undecaprenyl-diphosphatase UppP [Chloroflexi bacterium]|nr:undecaprenyl-diphosphatase UppP [Chloroflexota bacterium]MDL1943291.1 undecaprenyl-diphosphatase UppP [Chloroflexi bacterium CFX2]
MTILHALFLGIIQGLTEFIPVSSTAHLFIFSRLLGLPSNDRTFSFNVIVQLGTVLALLLFFWQDFWQIVKAFLLGIRHKKPFDDFHARLGWLVIVATIPAGLAGLILSQFVKSMSGDPLLWAGIRLLFTALLLTAVEYFDKKSRTLESATWMDALTVGLFQVLAIFPGASRSGSTMTGAMFRGFDRPSAARFAFLMSAPILTAAGLYESVQVILLPGTTEFLPILFTGFAASAAVGWLAIRWLLGYLRKHSLYIFAAYCLLAGIVVLIFK